MSQPKNSKKSSPRPFFRNPALITLGVAAILGFGIWFFTGFSSAAAETGDFHHVRRDNMLVSITEGGTLNAAREVSIISEVEGEASIIYIIPEGTLAEEGDLLVELDASDLEENLSQREISYQNALSSFTEAKENLKIKKSETESEIKLAELELEFAGTDQAKYIEGDWPQQEKTAMNDIRIARIELKRAQERFEQTKKLEKQGYATRSELETDELEVTRGELEVEQAEETLRLLTKYEDPKRLRELESDLEQAAASLDRARSRASAELIQAEATLRAREATMNLEKSRLDRVTRQLENTRIYAPQSGLVVYSSNRDRGQDVPMEEGTRVRQRQEIIKLPDLSRMVVEVKVHESQVSQVRKGQKAFVTIDSIPDRRFRGTIQRVAVLPDSQSRWLNPDLKVYSTEVLIEEELPEVNPGVSARAEIMVNELEDVVQVPIQAVTTRDGQRIVYRSTGSGTEAVPVDIGLFNDSFVEIRSGLVEGDRVVLSAPRRSGSRRSGSDDPESDEADEEGEPDIPVTAADALATSADSAAGEEEPATDGEAAQGNGGDGKPAQTEAEE